MARGCGKDNAPNPHGCTCTSGYSIESATARCERGETRSGVHKAKATVRESSLSMTTSHTSDRRTRLERANESKANRRLTV